MGDHNQAQYTVWFGGNWAVFWRIRNEGTEALCATPCPLCLEILLFLAGGSCFAAQFTVNCTLTVLVMLPLLAITVIE